MLVACLLILTMCVTLKVEGKMYDSSLSEKILGTSSKVCNTNSDVLRFAAMGHEAGLMDGVDSSVLMETKPSQYLSLKKTLLSVKSDLITGSDDEINLGDGMKWPEGSWSQPAYEKVTNFNYEGSTDIIYATVLQRVISNKEEQADSLNLKASVSASYMGADVKASLSYAKDTEYSESRVVFEKASYLELCPQILDRCPTPRESATNFLINNGTDQFLKYYGTHFAIGYQSVVSGRYTNVVETQTSNDKFKVAANLSASFLGIGTGAVGGSYDREKDTFASQSHYSWAATGTSYPGPDQSNATEVFLWFDNQLFDKEYYNNDKINTIFFAHSACQWYQDLLLKYPNASDPLPDIPVPSDFLFNFGQEVRYFKKQLETLEKVVCQDTIIKNLYPNQTDVFNDFYRNKSDLVKYYKDLETYEEVPFYENDYELQSLEITSMVNKVQDLISDVTNRYPLSCRSEDVNPSKEVNVMKLGYSGVSFVWDTFEGYFLRYKINPDLPPYVSEKVFPTLCVYDGPNYNSYINYGDMGLGDKVQFGVITNSSDCSSTYYNYDVTLHGTLYAISN